MVLTCPCQSCGGLLDFEPHHVGQLADCPHCGNETTLFKVNANTNPPLPVPIQNPLHNQAALSVHQSTMARIKLRDSTAYANERNWFKNLFVLSGIAAVFTVVICFIAIQQEEIRPSTGIGLIIVSIANAITMYLISAIANAIFDIADCALKKTP
jgi:hypothetical protein